MLLSIVFNLGPKLIIRRRDLLQQARQEAE